MAVIPLRKDQPQPASPRKLAVSSIEGSRQWGSGTSYQMIASSDGSVELIGHRKTLLVRDGKRLVRTLGRFVMDHWTDGDLAVRWVYGDADGAPHDPGWSGPPQHWLWLDITVGTRTIPMSNPVRGGEVVPDVEHCVLSNSSAQYHGKKLREALRRLGA
jgi:hypothetical protein